MVSWPAVKRSAFMARGIADGSRGAPLAPPPGLRYLRSEPRRPPARLSFPDSSVRLAVKTDDLDYELPDELIAQAPLERRDGARLLVPSAQVVPHVVRPGVRPEHPGGCGRGRKAAMARGGRAVLRIRTLGDEEAD